MNLSGTGGDSEKKKILKGNQKDFYFKILLVAKETRERKVDFLFCSFHNTTVLKLSDTES